MKALMLYAGKICVFLLLPVCVLEGLVQTVGRRHVRLVTEQIDRYRDLGRDDTVDAVFIGTSRVAAAIDVETFAATYQEVTGDSINAVNMGLGATNLVIYVLAVKRALERNPNALAGKTVLLEAPEGMPWQGQRWQTAWANPSFPFALVHVLAWKELPTYWFIGRDSIAVKSTVTLCKAFDIALSWVLIRVRVTRKLDEWLARARGQMPQPSPLRTVDLSRAGGIRTDAGGVQAAKTWKQITLDKLLANTQPWAPWEESVFADLARLVHQAGGTLVMYRMPLPPWFRELYKMPVRKDDRLHFSAWLSRHPVTYLDTGFTVTAVDFPDDWHLRKSLAPEFSAALARALARTNAVNGN